MGEDSKRSPFAGQGRSLRNQDSERRSGGLAPSPSEAGAETSAKQAERTFIEYHDLSRIAIGVDRYYADRVFITENGALGLDCGGRVVVMPIREWHALAWGGQDEPRD